MKIKKTDCFRGGKQSVFICRYSVGLASSGVAGMGVKLGSGVGCGVCVCSGVGSGVNSGVGVQKHMVPDFWMTGLSGERFQ